MTNSATIRRAWRIRNAAFKYLYSCNIYTIILRISILFYLLFVHVVNSNHHSDLQLNSASGPAQGISESFWAICRSRTASFLSMLALHPCYLYNSQCIFKCLWIHLIYKLQAWFYNGARILGSFLIQEITINSFRLFFLPFKAWETKKSTSSNQWFDHNSDKN